MRIIYLTLILLSAYFAELLYIKKSTLCRYENGEREISVRLLGENAELLYTDANYLIYGNDEWLGEMYSVLTRLQDKKMRDVAMKQMKCFLEAE